MQDYNYQRRNSKWYELIIFNPYFWYVLGFACVLILPLFSLWGWLPLEQVASTRLNALYFSFLAYSVSWVLLLRLRNYPGVSLLLNIAPIVSLCYFVVFAILLFGRIEYSRPALLVAFIANMVWSYLSYFVGQRFRRLKYAVLPMEHRLDLSSSKMLELRYLTRPDLCGVRYDAIVADFSSKTLTPEWERFLAQCILANIPVFNVRQVVEGLTGRVQIDHLSANALGSLLPAPTYVAVKRIMDVVLVLILMPLCLPLMALLALIIRFDSPGPALFIQKRVGKGNTDFNIYKFRSMTIAAEDGGAKFASQADKRITRVGSLLRKSRLDELPQLFNVLKGDMSLIGPRPEQRVFVNQFEAEIPFYIYRHVVRPGITGWAQVMQGYVGNSEETRLKIQYDFYYIKHFSLWLDLLIVFKTIRIVLTGWGAR